eukprot:TRINITY_DN12704_c0_g1_i4.p1 TRINITY_DN12704_c0_g1~~TRINITY_DN12704_c0_g1_i4.p1  ORF type:complete len:290 (-),score=47.00 TRINITY_DN12704_c0_g1_i4:190-1059(-)
MSEQDLYSTCPRGKLCQKQHSCLINLSSRELKSAKSLKRLQGNLWSKLVAISQLVGKLKSAESIRERSENSVRPSKANESTETKDSSKKPLQDSLLKQLKSFPCTKSCSRKGKLQHFRTSREKLVSPFLAALAEQRNSQRKQLLTLDSKTKIDSRNTEGLVENLESKKTTQQSKEIEKLKQRLTSKPQQRKTHSRELIKIRNKEIKDLIDKIQRTDNVPSINTYKANKLSFEYLRSVRTEADLRLTEAHTERNLKQDLEALKKKIMGVVKCSAEKDKEIKSLKEQLNLI